MPEIFGTDIAGIVASALQDAGGLREGVVNGHSFEGFTETKSLRTGDERFEGALTYAGTPLLNIVGASVEDGYVPKVNDVATLDGRDYELRELLARDPADALYVFRVDA